jgi:hypothetical protein
VLLTFKSRELRIEDALCGLGHELPQASSFGRAERDVEVIAALAVFFQPSGGVRRAWISFPGFVGSVLPGPVMPSPS